MNEYHMEVGVLNWKANAPRHSAKDYEVIINDIKKPIRNPAPRGKRIINPNQARCLYFDLSQEDSCISADSTFSRSSIEQSKAGISSCVTPVVEDKRLTGTERRLHKLQVLRERQLQYHKQEMALGGYHDVFNDTCPDFKPRKFVREESVITSDEVSQETVQSDDTFAPQDKLIDGAKLDEGGNIARSSQGRVGEGCSTPRNLANHTFAPLRTIDVSVVNTQDNTSNERTFHTRSRKMAEENSAAPSRAHFAQGVDKTVADSVNLDNRNAHNDSMENVLSKMRCTPKKIIPVVKAGTFAILGDRSEQNTDGNASRKVAKSGLSAVECSSTPTPCKQATVESHESQIGTENNVTYTVEPLQNETYVLEEKTSVEKSRDISKMEQGDGVSTCTPSNTSTTADVVFAVPALPRKTSRNGAKTTVHERERRAVTSQKKNSSILEVMNLDLRSPGRTLFAALPRKKQRSLATTPAKARSFHNEDEMEISIVMSDISQQPSVESGDDSVVDPLTDPRPSQTTPSRFTQTSTTSSTVPTSVETPVNYTKASVRPRKMDIIQKSVERLSQPRTGASCRRVGERCGLSNQISPCLEIVSSCSDIEPVTPFQPIDPSRMFIRNAERSGTARRVPPSKRVNNLLSRSSLFSHDLEAKSKQIRSNLLKRPGEYNLKSIHVVSSGRKTALESSEKEASTSPMVSLHENPNYSALGVSNDSEIRQRLPKCPEQLPQSSRIPAGKNIVSSPSMEVVADIDENILLDAAQRLSLEDASPVSASHVAQNDCESTDQVANCGNAELLMDSIFTTNTPGRSPSENFKRTLDSPDLEDSRVSRIEPVTPRDDLMVSIENDSLGGSIGESKNGNDVSVMILKPREVVNPSTPTTPNVRRSVRNRMKPVRQWLGEKPVYNVSPGGGRTLVGVTEVEVREKRWLRVKTADFRLAQEREQQLAAHRRFLREKKRQEARERKKNRIDDLRARHRRGQDLHISVDSIVTSSDNDESE